MSWTLAEQAAFTNAADYRNRIGFAFLKTANDVVNEDSNTANHVSRLALAQQVIAGNGMPPRATMLRHILNPALQIEGGVPTDNDILFTVSSTWNYFSGV